MITFIKLGQFGKMGNQLFQLSAAISLAVQNNDQYVFPPWKYEPYFNLHGCFSNNIKYTSTYEEPHFHYTPIPYKPNLNLSGYYQSWRYWFQNEDYIHQLFTPKQQFPFREDTASIHVRRTDYLNYPNHHPFPGMEYYEKGMKAVDVNKFIVFSDDIPWCKQHFIGNQFEFSEGQHEVTDLSLQSSCAHNICANSTFSWWSAYLNKNPNKIVIAPKRWFGPALSMHNIKDLFPDGWLTI